VIVSMTGYGTGEVSRDGVHVKVELRSVNHRYFDPAIRISRQFAGLEGRVRELLAARIARGRVGVNVEIEVEGAGERIVFDEGLARGYAEVIQDLKFRFEANGPVDPVAFAQLPELLARKSQEVPAESVEGTLTAALDAALTELLAMRRREGEALAQDLAERIGNLVDRIAAVHALADRTPERIRRRLEERIAALVPEGVTPDAERLATEVALAADRADVTEELVRFRAHAEAFREYLAREEPVGRRLDFLLQEMNREANTIGAKAVSAQVSQQVVEIKDEIERLREQVQNIE
jgi:uncharacterized protein (TIGR00255 family)